MATAAAAKPKEFNFVWEGKDKTGKQVKGEMRAGGEALVNATLRRQGIVVSKIKKRRTGGGSVGEKDIALFTRQLATMMKAGVPLLQSFDNQLKSDAGWLPLVTAAQSRPDRLERETHARARLLAVTASDLQAAVRRYLVPERLLDVEVQPAPTKPAAQPAAPSSPAATPAGG